MPRARRRAQRRLALVAEQDLKLVQERRPQRRLLRVGDLLLVMRERGARRRERRAADPAILILFVFVARTNRDRGLVAPLMVDAERDERLTVLLRGDLVDRAGQPDREDFGLLIVGIVVGREREGRLPALTHGTAEDTFEDPLLLGRSGRRERVAGVEMRVADEDISLAFVLLSARLRQDLDPAPARPRVFRRIRILIDFDLLHRRRADAQRADFHAVDHNGRAARAERAGIEEARDRGDVVLIEDRQSLERALVDRHRIQVVRTNWRRLRSRRC